MKVSQIKAKKLVTIVVPTFNQSSTLAQSLESLVDLQDIAEIIVVNDGSTDATSVILEDYKNLFVVITQKNQGQIKTMNNVWLSSQTDFLSYLSSDDLFDPSGFRKLLDQILQLPDAVCVYGSNHLIDKKGNILKRNIVRDFSPKDALINHRCSIAVGPIFQKSAAEQVGFWDPSFSYCSDREFWLRLSQKGNFYFYPNHLCGYYRKHDNSLTFGGVNQSRYLSDSIKILSKNIDLLEESELVLSIRNLHWKYSYQKSSRNISEAQGDFVRLTLYVLQKVWLKVWQMVRL